jgi:hypothetical protein
MDKFELHNHFEAIRTAFFEFVEKKQTFTIVDRNWMPVTFEPNPSKGEHNWRANGPGWESSRNTADWVLDEVRHATGFVLPRGEF